MNSNWISTPIILLLLTAVIVAGVIPAAKRDYQQIVQMISGK